MAWSGVCVHLHMRVDAFMGFLNFTSVKDLLSCSDYPKTAGGTLWRGLCFT